jgi:hypothetical protein
MNNPSESPSMLRSKMIADPSSFSEFVYDLDIEPISRVKDRFFNKKEDPTYTKSNQYTKDVYRLAMELDDTENYRTKISRIFKEINEKISKAFAITPAMARRQFGSDNVVNFYSKSLKGVGKLASLEEINSMGIVSDRLSDISKKLRGLNHYAAVLDEIAFQRDIGPRSKLSKKLYDLSYQLPLDKYADYAKRLRVVAAEVNNPEYKDPGRVTTKNDKLLAEEIIKHPEGIATFLVKLEDMAEPDEKDTYKDRMIKEIYRAFINQMKHHSTDTPGEMIKINEDADKLITEITKTNKISQNLIDQIDRYKRKFK